MQAVILAGGLGARLRPMTEKIPKPMVKIGDEPFLSILLKQLRRNNFDKIILLVAHLSNFITDYFRDGSKFGLEIQYSYEKKLLGTGGSLKNAYQLLENEFVLINGDTYLDLDFQSFIQFSRMQKSPLTFVAYTGPLFDNLTYNMTLNKEGVITNYSKSGIKANLNAIDAGIYFFKKNLLELFYDGEYSLENEFFPWVIKNKKIFACSTTTKFYDIGSVNGLEKFKLFINNQVKGRNNK